MSLSNKMNTLCKYAFQLIISLFPNGIISWVRRMQGNVIGDNVKWGVGSCLYGRANIGSHTTIGAFSRLESKKLTLGHGCKIGSFAKLVSNYIGLGDNCKIGKQTIVAGRNGPNCRLTMGNRSSIGPRSYIDTAAEVFIGHDTHIGDLSFIFTHACGHCASILDGYPRKIATVTIGANAWLTNHVFVMPGVCIGLGAVVEPGSVVGVNLPPLSIAQGSPARIVNKFDYTQHAANSLDTLQNLKCILQRDFPDLAANGLLTADSDYPVEIKEFVFIDTPDIETLKSLDNLGKSWWDISTRRCSFDAVVAKPDLVIFFELYGLIFEPTRITEDLVFLTDSEIISDYKQLVSSMKVAEWLKDF